MKIKSQYIICCLFCLLFACQSEIDKFDVTNYIAPGNFEDALALVQDLRLDHTLVNENGGTIVLDNSIIQFPPNAFVQVTGEPVIGDVIVSTIEINEKRDFIKYNLSCEDDQGMPLSAESIFHISANKDDAPLKLNDQVEAPDVYIFDETIEDASIYGNSEDLENGWMSQASELQSGEISYELNGEQFDAIGYAFSLTSMNWVSVQKELQISNYVSLCLKLSESNTPNNTLAYLIADNKNSCQRLTVSSDGECAMTEVPDELEGTIVILAHKGLLDEEQQLEAESRRVLITNGQAHFEMMPVDMDEAEFIAFVQGL